MCIKTVKSIGVDAAVESVKGHLQVLDMGKVLGVAGKVLEINPKAVLAKIDIRDEDVRLKIKNKLNLVIDFMQWPFIMVTGGQPWTW